MWSVLRHNIARRAHSRGLASVTGTVYRAGDGGGLAVAAAANLSAGGSATAAAAAAAGAATAAPPTVTLFTKENCSLCDDVTAVLAAARRAGHEHTLEALDITDAGHERWHALYQYDIPVLHVGRVGGGGGGGDDGGSMYWAKHRLTAEEAAAGLAEAAAAAAGTGNSFAPRAGEPRGGWPEK